MFRGEACRAVSRIYFLSLQGEAGGGRAATDNLLRLPLLPGLSVTATPSTHGCLSLCWALSPALWKHSIHCDDTIRRLANSG